MRSLPAPPFRSVSRRTLVRESGMAERGVRRSLPPVFLASAPAVPSSGSDVHAPCGASRPRPNRVAKGGRRAFGKRLPPPERRALRQKGRTSRRPLPWFFRKRPSGGPFGPASARIRRRFKTNSVGSADQEARSNHPAGAGSTQPFPSFRLFLTAGWTWTSHPVSTCRAGGGNPTRGATHDGAPVFSAVIRVDFPMTRPEGRTPR